jgi:NAD(P)-dependent dehydrogenase (short-subunit alcohol dehydrogenase family)
MAAMRVVLQLHLLISISYSLQLWAARIPRKSVVVITGCDSGFGALASEALALRGFTVVSTCLTEDGASRMRKIGVALATLCDVTREADVLRVADETERLMTEQNARLWAVINNAGIAPLGYCDWVSIDTFRKVMDVNYIGVVSFTKAMLPLLKRTKNSRIINLSSVAGLSGGPMFGPYAGKISTIRREPNNLVVAV